MATDEEKGKDMDGGQGGRNIVRAHADHNEAAIQTPNCLKRTMGATRFGSVVYGACALAALNNVDNDA